MKRTAFLVYFVLQVSLVQAQKLYKSYDQYNTISKSNIKVPDNLIKDAMKRTGYDNLKAGEAPYMYANEHKNGYISIGDDDRVSVAIYDNKQKWVETHIYYWDGDTNSTAEAENKKAYVELSKLALAKGYSLDNDIKSYTKIINATGIWYEMPLKEGTLIGSQKFKFVALKK